LATSSKIHNPTLTGLNVPHGLQVCERPVFSSEKNKTQNKYFDFLKRSWQSVWCGMDLPRKKKTPAPLNLLLRDFLWMFSKKSQPAAS
jgi:hypothetical protein